MRSARRLIVAVIALVAIDQCVPAVLSRLERRRYEDRQAFRFDSSDLFGLGPLVSYLREHPRGERPRTLFLGNSVMFGYELSAGEAVPARFQERHPETQVFNAAINGFEMGSNYLVAAATLESVDRLYVMRGSNAANPLLASLIPVNEYVAEGFHQQRPNLLEAQLQRIADHWHLYASSYRLQAAMFGTSTREYIHRQTRPAPTRTFPSLDGAVVATSRQSAVAPGPERQAELRRRDSVLWQFCGLVAYGQTRLVIIQIGAPKTGSEDEAEVADFNAACAPYARIVTLTIAPVLIYDGRHLTPIGARRVAEALP